MNIFDIIGPVMIGPSSSHTAGAARIGYVARKILAQEPVEAEIGLAGSFAQTYKGHGTDRALIAGILGMRPDDERLPHSLELAEEQGLRFSFRTVQLPKCHPNTAVIKLTGKEGAVAQVEGASVGGGNILITRLNGMESAFTGQCDTLIIPHRDTPGVIATVTQALAHEPVRPGGADAFRPAGGLRHGHCHFGGRVQRGHGPHRRQPHRGQLRHSARGGVGHDGTARRQPPAGL